MRTYDVEIVKNYLNEDGLITSWPSKQAKKIEVLRYMADKFEFDRQYTEKEVNAIIEQWHTFSDLFLLRRGMCDYKLLLRTRDGAAYWREPESEDEA